jgi:ATP-dependent Lon protease
MAASRKTRAAECGSRPGRFSLTTPIVAGHLALGGSLEPIHNATDLVERAFERGTETILLPVSCRRALADLSDDLATRVQVLFYADAADVLRKTLVV